VSVETLAGRSDRAELAAAAEGVDAVLIAVTDRRVAAVASAIEPSVEAAVLHCSGSLGLDVLSGGGHRRRGSIHPLATLPEPGLGSLRLLQGTYYAVSGDRVAFELASLLGGTLISVAEERRALYHAAACVASNHIVALLGQVERLAAEAGVPFEAFLPLAAGALDDVALLGTTAALTGPAARGDRATIATHLAAIDRSERAAYEALMQLAGRLAAARNEPTSEAAAGDARATGVPRPAKALRRVAG
jgi:predicted short-subunit dehydrogenase-like oxidoreductase (DUF2520 family)